MSDKGVVEREREFTFTARDFTRIQRLIYAHAGIFLRPHKEHMVYSRLARRLRARRLTRFADYLDLIADTTHPEWQAFVNALTTNLTAFFREPHHFPVLARHLQEQRRLRPAETLRVWSAASSTGEEAYSIAMTAIEITDGPRPPVTILASDVDTDVLQRARAGVYPRERVEGLAPARLKRFFLEGVGENAGRVRVRPVLQSLVEFRVINLLSSSWDLPADLPARRFDAIFCRNVMIYFDRATQRAVLERLAAVLRPDGLLFAGHSESFHHSQDLFRACGKTVYAPAAGARGTHAA